MHYGDHQVLKGVDLEVGAGEIFGFLGPNGAGKTTTIEILEGYRKRSSGEVEVLGSDPGQPSRGWRERIGLVLQECQLDPLLTVSEILELYSSFYRRPRDIGELIALVGLEGRENQRLGRLSGGQQRRADVALALVGDPELIFLDEPTTGFDPTARRDAWKMIKGLKAIGKTVLLTTHYMEEAQALADTVAIIRGGEIVARGTPDEIVGAGARRATICFRESGEATADAVRTVVGLPVHTDGGRLTIEAQDTQPTLLALLSWADRHQLALEALEVRRPTLEDTFLELTGGEGEPAGGADERHA